MISNPSSTVKSRWEWAGATLVTKKVSNKPQLSTKLTRTVYKYISKSFWEIQRVWLAQSSVWRRSCFLQWPIVLRSRVRFPPWTKYLCSPHTHPLTILSNPSSTVKSRWEWARATLVTKKVSNKPLLSTKITRTVYRYTVFQRVLGSFNAPG